jgi:hypothetical protein
MKLEVGRLDGVFSGDVDYILDTASTRYDADTVTLDRIKKEPSNRADKS